jgi:SAM-dependent methyltransferase
MPQQCQVCKSGSLSENPLIVKEGLPFHQCENCESILIPDDFMHDTDRSQKYDIAYWEAEKDSSLERSFGSSICRIAETFLYCRIPITSFLDIGCGPGFTLDAMETMLPRYVNIFKGIELNPPPPKYRSKSRNYTIGSVSDLRSTFQAGICIEVIEHLPPRVLEVLVKQLASKSEQGSIFYFNSSQPEKVIRDGFDYLDPYRRGHIASYSIKGLSGLFSQYGFSLIPLFGRDWAFLAEYKPDPSFRIETAEQLLKRIWSPNPANMNILQNGGFGPLMYTIGIESARCYIENSIRTERTRWALSLRDRLNFLKSKQMRPK